MSISSSELLGEAARKAEAEICCYCLMPNHVHIIIVPSDEDGLRRTFADAHRRYTGYINVRLRVIGHLWQGRFGSVVMDKEYLAHAVRYVSMNPVRAGLVERAEEWRGDDDQHLVALNGRNTGREKAQETAQQVNGIAVFPVFALNERASQKLSDFNDLANKSALGLEAVKRQVGAAIEKAIQQHTIQKHQSQHQHAKPQN